MSPGCANCYADLIAKRQKAMGTEEYRNGFKQTVHDYTLDDPLKIKKPKRIFVNSMSDLFHKDIPTGYIDRVFDIMEQADRHTFQILTKRSTLMRKFANERYAKSPPPKHIWLGVSVESQAQKSRIAHLRDTICAVRFLSLEPLIGPIPDLDLTGIHWAIVGGESGPGARPMKAEWVRSIRGDCIIYDIPFLFKQWGGARPKSNGRILDGRVWDQYPVAG